MIQHMGMKVSCDFCEASYLSKYSYDISQMAAVAMELGWRQFEDQEYCPECVKLREEGNGEEKKETVH